MGSTLIRSGSGNNKACRNHGVKTHLLSDLLRIFHANVNQVAEHHGPKTRADLLHASNPANQREGKERDSAQNEEAVRSPECPNFFFDLACCEHVAKKGKEIVK